MNLLSACRNVARFEHKESRHRPASHFTLKPCHLFLHPKPRPLSLLSFFISCLCSCQRFLHPYRLLSSLLYLIPLKPTLPASVVTVLFFPSSSCFNCDLPYCFFLVFLLSTFPDLPFYFHLFCFFFPSQGWWLTASHLFPSLMYDVLLYNASPSFCLFFFVNLQLFFVLSFFSFSSPLFSIF